MSSGEGNSEGAPTRRTALLGFSAAGLAGWMAPAMLSVDAAAAQSGAPTMANYIQATLSSGGGFAPLGQPIPFDTTVLASGFTLSTGVNSLGQIVASATGVYRATSIIEALQSLPDQQFRLAVNGQPVGYVTNPAALLDDHMFFTDDLVALSAGDHLSVVHTAGNPAPPFVDGATITVVQVA